MNNTVDKKSKLQKPIPSSTSNEVAYTTLEKSLAKPLFDACIDTDHKSVVAVLLQGANPNLKHLHVRDGEAFEIAPLQAMLMAVSNGDATPRMLRKQVVRIAKALFEAGAEFGNLEQDLLLSTVALDAEELLDFLVERGARVKRRHAFELMSLAMANESILMINALIKQNVNPNIRDAHFSTPFLDWCSGLLKSKSTVKNSFNKDCESISQLIGKFAASGVDIDLSDHLGATPLMRALVVGENEIAKALILSKANTEIFLRNGVGALHLAVVCGSQDFLRFLSRQEISMLDLNKLDVRNLQPDVKAIFQTLKSKINS